MSPFSLISNHMGVHVSCFNQSILSCNRDRFHIRMTPKTPCFKSYRGSCNLVSISGCGSHCLSSLGCYNCGKSSNGLSCYKETRSVISMSNGNNPRNSPKIEASDRRKRFSLRLRPRLRLLSNRLKRVSFRAMLKDFVIYVQKNLKQVTLSTVVSVALVICYLFLRLTSVASPRVVPYSDLISNLQSGSVSKVLFEEGSRRIYYNAATQVPTTPTQVPTTPGSFEKQSSAGDKLSENVGETVLKPGGMKTRPLIGMSMFGLRRPPSTRVSTPVWQYSTRKIDHDENFLLTLMREKGTIYSSAPQSVLMSVRTILITILTLWIPLTPLMWLLYRQLSTTNSLAKKRRPTNQTVSFEDVEGVDTAKAELMEIVLCLQGAINYSRLGAKLPRGVLLAGPPGTGKTLLARAVAGEAGVPFFTVSASEFVEMFVGRGASRIRDLFSTARKSAPSIIFIDELDAVGGKRGRSFNDERDQTLNQLLTEMDGFETDTKVIVIAATNRPEALDSALCRPGRFSRKVFVGKPDEEGRRKILAVHLRGVPLEEDPYIISNLVASLTQGFVGADLANIVNEAALLAARRGGETVAREDIMDAVERAKYGINDNLRNASAIRKELGKLLPWVPSFMRKDNTRENELQEPLGYQTLS